MNDNNEDVPQQNMTDLKIKRIIEMTEMKILNRSSNKLIKENKLKSIDDLNENDKLNNDLKILLFERMHLELEIKKCKSVENVYESIDLNETEGDDIKTKLLNELNLRKTLNENKKELQLQRVEMNKLNNGFKDDLELIDLELNKVIKDSIELNKKFKLIESKINN